MVKFWTGLIAILVSVFTATGALAEVRSDEYRLFVLRDPVTLHPLKSLAGATSHVLNNIFRGYYRYEDNRGLQSELVTCDWAGSKEFKCKLKKNLRYSNGEEILADDFVRSLQMAQSNEAHPTYAAELTNVKTVKKISDNEFSVILGSPDRDFLARMASPVFSPLPAGVSDDQQLARDYATGPYRLKSWERGRYLLLEPNPNYHAGAPQLTLKIYVVTDETTALRMYQTGQLDFLRRVPSEYYDEVKNLPGFGLLPLLRMDYLGLADQLADEPKLREAMTLSLDYEEFKRAFKALGRPGCYGLSESIAGEPICYQFNPAKAKVLMKDVDLSKFQKPRLRIYISDQGGDHNLRGAQWFQAQWKKNLGLQVDIEVTEHGVLTDKLNTSPPAIFRRGVPVDRATCLAALEPFSAGNPDNFLKLDRPKVGQNIQKLRTEPLTQAQKKQVCRESLKDLLSTNRFIPLGEIHFMTIENKAYSGLALNALGQLDLSKLRKLKPDQSPSDK